MSRKTIFLGVIGILTFVAIFTYFNTLTYKSDAAGNGVNLRFMPTESKSRPDEENIVDVFLTTADATKKISGFDITLHSDPRTTIVEIGAPQAVGSESAALFTRIIHTIASNSAHLSYVSPTATTGLPSTVAMKITYKGSSPGNGQIAIEPRVSQVVGTAQGAVFTWGTIDALQVHYVSCSHKEEGDVDCDDKIDLVDFEGWRKEFTGEAKSRHADFDKSGRVTVRGFEMWRKHFFPHEPEPSITITPPSPTGEGSPSATIIPLPTRVTSSCGWCGTNCLPSLSDRMCPMIMPPTNKKCITVKTQNSATCEIIDTEKENGR